MNNESDAARHPELTALDLANLAAKLHPELCRVDANAALKAAFQFYNQACRWAERHEKRTASDIILEATGTQYEDEIWQEIAEQNREAYEKGKLRFYPDRQMSADDVRKFLGVKTARAVRDKVRKWFLAAAEHRGKSSNEGNSKFLDYWNAALREDEVGKPFYALPKDLLKDVKSLERAIKREGGLKAVRVQRRKTRKQSKNRHRRRSR